MVEDCGLLEISAISFFCGIITSPIFKTPFSSCLISRLLTFVEFFAVVPSSSKISLIFLPFIVLFTLAASTDVAVVITPSFIHTGVVFEPIVAVDAFNSPLFNQIGLLLSPTLLDF